ncbi:MAG: HAMP domain-containing protein, partial [Betaproteobacteria bacterium]|nr:HAMP domain-containing protein [Betaproteobacteria bacterium]
MATEERGAALHRAETESVYVADMASLQHAYQVLGARQLLDRIPALVVADEYGLGELPQLLSAILSGLPQFANLGVMNLDGEIAYSVIPPPREVNMAGIDAFQRALESREVAVGTYLVGPIVERPILIMAKALRNAQDQPTKVLFAALDLAWLDRLAQEAGLPPDSAMLIADRNGTILASSLTTAPPKHGADNRLKGFAQLIQHPNTLTPCEAPDGIARLAVATPLKGVNDVWVVVGPPEANIHAVANWIFIRDVTVLALFAIFAIASSLIATDLSVLRDIRLLANATQRFGRGELNVRAPIPLPGGEIRDLTEAFNTMADTPERRHRQALRSQERLRALSHR